GMANIVWVNEGDSSDHFNQVFGTRAATARGIVERALFDWNLVITNFNRSDGSNTLQVNISVDPNQHATGGAAMPGDRVGTKPKTGSFTIQAGSDGHGGDYILDNTPFESSEFDGTLNA